VVVIDSRVSRLAELRDELEDALFQISQAEPLSAERAALVERYRSLPGVVIALANELSDG
jgi:hypothetical protein